MKALDLDEADNSLDNKDMKEENKPCKGPTTILYGGDDMSMRTLTDNDETVLECAVAATEERLREKESNEAMPLTKVLRNCRRNEYLPSSARLANAKKHTQFRGWNPTDREARDYGQFLQQRVKHRPHSSQTGPLPIERSCTGWYPVDCKTRGYVQLLHQGEVDRGSTPENAVGLGGTPETTRQEDVVGSSNRGSRTGNTQGCCDTELHDHHGE